MSSKKAPISAVTPTGAYIETLGATMQVEGTRLYRVRDVATALDVSVATIYRAVNSGRLRAERIGTGTGAVRIPGEAIAAYRAECERAAVTVSAPEVPCTDCQVATADQSVDASGGVR